MYHELEKSPSLPSRLIPDESVPQSDLLSGSVSPLKRELGFPAWLTDYNTRSPLALLDLLRTHTYVYLIERDHMGMSQGRMTARY